MGKFQGKWNAHDLAGKMSAISVGSCGDEATDFDATFAGEVVEANKVHGESLDHGEMVSGATGSGAHRGR